MLSKVVLDQLSIRNSLSSKCKCIQEKLVTEILDGSQKKKKKEVGKKQKVEKHESQDKKSAYFFYHIHDSFSKRQIQKREKNNREGNSSLNSFFSSQSLFFIFPCFFSKCINCGEKTEAFFSAFFFMLLFYIISIWELAQVLGGL